MTRGLDPGPLPRRIRSPQSESVKSPGLEPHSLTSGPSYPTGGSRDPEGRNEPITFESPSGSEGVPLPPLQDHGFTVVDGRGRAKGSRIVPWGTEGGQTVKSLDGDSKVREKDRVRGTE